MIFLENWFGENPLPIVFFLVAIAVGFLALLAMTQNGRHLIRAIVFLAIAGVLLLIDYAWTTDRERLAFIVADVASAVRANNIDGVKKHLTPDAVYQQPGLPTGITFDSPLGKTLIREALDQVKFDFLRIRNLEISAGRRTGRGKADFNVYCAGTWNSALGGSAINFPPTNSSWSFGFRKEKDGTWKVDRITPTQLPTGRGQNSLPSFLKK